MPPAPLRSRDKADTIASSSSRRYNIAWDLQCARGRYSSLHKCEELLSPGVIPDTKSPELVCKVPSGASGANEKVLKEIDVLEKLRCSSSDIDEGQRGVITIVDHGTFPPQGHAFVIYPRFAETADDLLARLRRLPLNVNSAPNVKRLHRVVQHIALRTLEGLRLLHKHGLAHGDVKPQNILLSRELSFDASGGEEAKDGSQVLCDVALCDFSNSVEPDDICGVTEEGTAGFRPPECLVGEPSSAAAGSRRDGRASDMWSFGSTLASMFLLPVDLFAREQSFLETMAIFETLGCPANSFRIAGSTEPCFPATDICGKLGTVDALVKEYPWLSASAAELLLKLWAIQPSARPTAEQALRHHFFTCS